MGFNRKHFFKSAYFKAEDFESGPATFIIKAVREELVGPEKQLKCILDVVEEDKSFVLNVTNFNACAEEFGEDCDDWVGCSIRARRAMVAFSGKMVPAIRLKPIANADAKRSTFADDARDGDAEDAESAY